MSTGVDKTAKYVDSTQTLASAQVNAPTKPNGLALDVSAFATDYGCR